LTHEKNIDLENLPPIEIYGNEDSRLKQIELTFPKVKIVARGTTIKLIGSEYECTQVEEFIYKLNHYYEKNGSITEQLFEQLLQLDTPSTLVSNNNQDSNEIIVFGINGQAIKARTQNMLKLCKLITQNDMIFAIGPAGTGKTYTSVALAVKALKNKEVKRIVLTRPAVEAGENLGFLPGDLKDKLDPYLQPLFDALRDMVPTDKLNQYIESGIIQIAPLAYMRGRTLDSAFVILDEAQNATKSQMKMFLTRMGKTAKFIITGDASQIDLPKKSQSGLLQAIDILQNIEGIEFIHFDANDVIRHRLVKKIILAYDKAGSEN
jgi:phosphate starvation-inducible protein PhoH and related proteins